MSTLPLFGIALVGAMLAALAFRSILSSHVLLPLNEVTHGLEQLAKGDFTPHTICSTNETQLGRLASAYNAAVDQVRDALDERDRANTHIRQLIADAGHQLRTPLTVIRGFMTILEESLKAKNFDQQEHCFRVIRQQNSLMTSLIDNLMLLERWEHQPHCEDLEPIDISLLVGDIINTHKELHPQRIITLEKQTTETQFVRIDPQEMHYALNNLIDNALKYTDGAVRIVIESQGNEVGIAVIDHGPGMSVEFAASAFDRFSRGDRRDIEGSGLGLSIAKRAIERAYGMLDCTHSSVAGSTFRIGLSKVMRKIHRDQKTDTCRQEVGWESSSSILRID